MTAKQDYRVRVKIPAGFRTDDGAEFETSVTDISEKGCCLHGGTQMLRPGHGLSIQIGTLAPISAEVRWLYQSTCGVVFTRPLHGALVGQLQSLHTRGPLQSRQFPLR